MYTDFIIITFFLLFILVIVIIAMVSDQPKEAEFKPQYKYKIFKEITEEINLKITEEINLKSVKLAKALNDTLRDVTTKWYPIINNLEMEHTRKYRGTHDSKQINEMVEETRSAYLLKLKKELKNTFKTVGKKLGYFNYLKCLDLESGITLIHFNRNQIYYCDILADHVFKSGEMWQLFRAFEGDFIEKREQYQKIPAIIHKIPRESKIIDFWILGNKKELQNLIK